MLPPIVKRYLITLDKYKYIPVLTFFTGVGVSSIFALQPTPPLTYQANGVLATNTPPAIFSATGTQIQTQGTQLTENMLTSDNLFKSVSTKVNIPVQVLRKSARIRLAQADPKATKEQPQVIYVTYVDTQRERAEAAALALMQGLVEQSRVLNTLRTKAIIKSINDRLPKVQQDLKSSEQKLEQYTRREGPAIWAAQDGSLLGLISSSQQQRRQIQMTLGGIETQMRSLESKLGLDPAQAYTSSALSADPIIGNLRTQIYQIETQIQRLKRDLRAEHPTMIELSKNLQAYEEQLRQRAAEVIGNQGIGKPLVPTKIRQESSLDPTRQQLANTLVNLQTQKETLQQQLLATAQLEQEARREYGKVPNKQIEQARLQQQVQLHQAFYTKMQASLADAKLAEAETVSSLSIAQLPETSADIQPETNLLITVGAGALIGLLLGGGIVFFLSTLDSKLYTPEEIQAFIKERDVAVLGLLPSINILDSELGYTSILVKPIEAYLEYYERLRSTLRRTSDEPLKIVLFTSPLNNEGKTVSAYNLAIASALAGKRTLLVEADLRSPSCAKWVSVVPDAEAKLDPLNYYSHLSECIQLVPAVENLYIVPSPGPLRQAASILESSELRRLLEDAKGRFDFVVLDSTSLSICNDALLLEPYTDGIVLVTRPGQTQSNFLATAIDQFNEEELPLLGAIINGIDKGAIATDITETENQPVQEAQVQQPSEPVIKEKIKL